MVRALSGSRIARMRMVTAGPWQADRRPPEDVVQHLVAVQAQEHPYARWSVGQRCGAGAAEVDAAFADGRILRTHVLRPTWHYVAATELRWLMALSGPMVDARNTRRYEDLGLDARTRATATDVIAAAVAGGPLTRRDLADRLQAAGIDPDGQRLAHLVMHAELQSVICSGPMEGRQHTYAAFDDRVPAGGGPTGDEALAELTRRYFSTRGPATVKDLAWWAGLRIRDVRHGLSLVSETLDSHEVDGRTYWFAGLARPPTGPRVDLVQCYDEVIISYTESRDALTSGDIAFPVPRALDGFTHVVLLDGCLLGHWRPVRTSGAVTIETRLGRSLDGAKARALASAVERYEAFSTAI